MESISFVVVDRDVTHLSGLYINHCRNDRKKEDELTALMYDEDGRAVNTHLESFPVDAVKAGAQVIVCGFLP